MIPVLLCLYLSLFTAHCLFHLMLHPCPLVPFPIDSIQISDCILRVAIELLHCHHLYTSIPLLAGRNLLFPLEVFTSQSYKYIHSFEIAMHITLSVYWTLEYFFYCIHSSTNNIHVYDYNIVFIVLSSIFLIAIHSLCN